MNKYNKKMEVKSKSIIIFALLFVALNSTNTSYAIDLEKYKQGDSDATNATSPNANNNFKNGVQTVTNGNSDIILISDTNSFKKIETGDELQFKTIQDKKTAKELYMDVYGKNEDLKNETIIYQKAIEDLKKATNNIEKQKAKEIVDASSSKIKIIAQAINDKQTLEKATDKNKSAFIISPDDILKLANSDNTKNESISYNLEQQIFQDEISGKRFYLEVKTNFSVTSTEKGIPDVKGSILITTPEPEPRPEHYKDMRIANVEGENSKLVIDGGTKEKTENNFLDAITKDTTVFEANSGGSIEIKNGIYFNTGNLSHVASPFDKENNKTSKFNFYTGGIKWIGKLDATEINLGIINITNADEANDFNLKLINVLTAKDSPLQNLSPEKRQEVYDKYINKIYAHENSVNISGEYQRSEKYLEEIEALALKNRGNDSAFMSLDKNNFIGIKDKGSKVIIAEGAKLKGVGSYYNAPIIKADINDDSTNDADGRKEIIINGEIGYLTADQSKRIIDGKAIVAKNANIKVGEKGNVDAATSLKSGNIFNKGKMQDVDITDAEIINDGRTRNIISDSSVVTNNGIIKDLELKNNSTGHNTLNALINGKVKVYKDSNFTNDGKISGSIITYEGANAYNNNLLVGTNVLSVNEGSNYVNGETSDAYLGYTLIKKQDEHGNVTIDDISTEPISSTNKEIYIGMDIQGNYENQGSKINVSGEQKNIVAIKISGNANYKDVAGKTLITLNANDLKITNLPKGGNSNTAIRVDKAKNPTIIQTRIKLNDSGSVGIHVINSTITYKNGNIEVNSKDLPNGNDNTAIGIFIDGTPTSESINNGYATITNSTIKINGNSSIGIHVRNNAEISFDENSNLVFAADKKKQVGILVSGGAGKAKIEYKNPSQALTLSGEESVMFRVERGAIFSTEDTAGIEFNSQNSSADKSSLFVVTTGKSLNSGISNKSHLTIREGVNLKVGGFESSGIRVEGGATATIEKNVNINLNGAKNVFGIVDGKYYRVDGTEDSSLKGKSEVTTSADIDNRNYSGDAAKDSYGYIVKNNGTLIHKGTIDFTNEDNNLVGVLVRDGGTLITENSSNIKVKGTAVRIDGINSTAIVNNKDNLSPSSVEAIDGVAAYHITGGAKLKLTGSGETKASGTAHGIFIDGATKVELVDGAYLNLNNNKSKGSGIENKSELTDISINNAKIDVKDGIGIHSSVGFKATSGAKQTGIINVFGKGTGISFEDVNNPGHSTSNAIELVNAKDLIVNVKEQEGKGIYLSSSNTEKALVSASVNIIDESGNEAIIVEGKTTEVEQYGNLHSNSNNEIIKLNDDVVKFSNAGDIQYGVFTNKEEDKPNFTGYYSDKIALKRDINSKGMEFTNQKGGNINGVVTLLSEEGNKVNLERNSIGNKFFTGTGNDIFTIDGIKGIDVDEEDKQFKNIDGGQGEDSLIFNKSDFTITKEETIKNIENIKLRDETKLTMDKVLPDGTHLISINEDSSLFYNIDKDTTAKTRIKDGDNSQGGLLKIKGKGERHKFDFDPSKQQSGDFTGVVEVENISFNLKEHNQKTVEKATLRVSNKSLVEVSKGQQDVNKVQMNGGAINFKNIEFDIDPKNITAEHNIKTNELLVDNNNRVIVDTPNEIDIPIPPDLLDADKVGILAQDDENRAIQLIKSKTAKVNVGGSIEVTDKDGMQITEDVKVDIMQRNENVGRATYGVAGEIRTDGNEEKFENGLYLNIGLTKIELKAQEDTTSNALRLNAFGANSTAAELRAQVTDFVNDDESKIAGDLVIMGKEQVTLNNSLNDYTGKTIIEKGSSLKAGSDNSFGKTNQLKLKENAIVNINGKIETVGSLVSEKDSSVILNNGTLNVTQDNNKNNLNSVIAGNVKGAGTINVQKGSELEVTSSNVDLIAQINNLDSSIIRISKGDSLGESTLALKNNSKLEAIIADKNTEIITHSFEEGSASAFIEKSGKGTLQFSKDKANYKATTNVKEGTIIFDGGTVESNTINVNSKGNLVLNNGTDTIGEINNNGNVYAAGNINSDGIATIKKISNNKNLYVGNKGKNTIATNNKVIVDNYNGADGSKIFFNGELNGDSSTVNTLKIKNQPTGKSEVIVTNINGKGARIDKGVLLIETGSKDTPEETFTSKKYNVGAWTYYLQKGNKLQDSSSMSNFYLVNKSGLPIPAYYGGFSVAYDLVDLRLQDRSGSKEFRNMNSNPLEEDNSVWVRFAHKKTSEEDPTSDSHIRNKGIYKQVGIDLIDIKKNNSRNQMGIMFGQYLGRTSVEALEGSNYLDIKNEFYSAGLYNTWFKNPKENNNVYIDTWLQYIWGKNTWNGNKDYEFDKEKVKTNGWAFSMEVGNTRIYNQSERRKYYFEPKAQIIFSNISQDKLILDDSIIKQKDSFQALSRIGFRVGETLYDKNSYVKANHFIEINWLHSFQNYRVEADEVLFNKGIRNRYELKMGAEMQFNENWSGWGNIYGQLGKNSYHNFGAQVGIKYKF